MLGVNTCEYLVTNIELRCNTYIPCTVTKEEVVGFGVSADLAVDTVIDRMFYCFLI